ncbi:MAG: helix-turn-helix domain-containing protein [bacterium]|nr:helix-turn-helix domain-containing protein [bacterium]
MVNSLELDRIYRCLADPTRRDILLRLALSKTPLTVGQISREYVPGRMSEPAISKHLRVLEKASLISRNWRGRNCEISLVSETLFGAKEDIEGVLKLLEAKLSNIEV